MDAFLKVIKKFSKVSVKINIISDRYKRLPLEYQSKIGCDSLIQSVFVKELINIMGTVITDSDIEWKMKISNIKYLESKTTPQIFRRVW